MNRKGLPLVGLVMLTGLLALGGCDAIAGRVLGPAARRRACTVSVVVLRDAAGDSVGVARVEVCRS